MARRKRENCLHIAPAELRIGLEHEGLDRRRAAVSRCLRSRQILLGVVARGIADVVTSRVRADRGVTPMG